MSLLKQRYYFYDFFKGQDQIPDCYEHIVNKSSSSTLYQSANKERENRKVCKINHIPDYVKVGYMDESRLRVKKIYRTVGYAADLTDFENVDTYVNQQFKKGRQIRKYIRQLETSFNIRYERFYGAIDKDVYDDLLARLYTMVENRFDQLNDVNNQIRDKERWQTTLNETYGLIHEKRASILVIYEDDNPILINIAHHWGVVFYDFMFSFDIDYSKFSLGHISFYKNIEWCIDQGYKIFDTGPGEYTYKKRWANLNYDLLQHIIYEKNSVKSKVLGNLELALTLLSKYRESFSVKPYKKLIKRKSARKKRLKNSINVTYLKTEQLDLSDYEKIDYGHTSYRFLKKIVFDFLFSKSEHKTDVEVFKSSSKDNFLIRGKSNAMIYDLNSL